jgi:hypothetical protein
VVIGDYSTLAGIGIQVWTHGYVHDTSGPGRYRIDGAVRIGTTGGDSVAGVALDTLRTAHEGFLPALMNG